MTVNELPKAQECMTHSLCLQACLHFPHGICTKCKELSQNQYSLTQTKLRSRVLSSLGSCFITITRTVCVCWRQNAYFIRCCSARHYRTWGRRGRVRADFSPRQLHVQFPLNRMATDSVATFLRRKNLPCPDPEGNRTPARPTPNWSLTIYNGHRVIWRNAELTTTPSSVGVKKKGRGYPSMHLWHVIW